MTTELGFIVDEQGRIVWADDFYRQIADMTRWFNEVFVPALAEISRNLQESLTPAFVQLAGAFSQIDSQALVPLDDLELAYRAYARWFNARHPGRHISWRRLTRHERQAAAWAWLAERPYSTH